MAAEFLQWKSTSSVHILPTYVQGVLVCQADHQGHVISIFDSLLLLQVISSVYMEKRMGGKMPQYLKQCCFTQF